MKKIALITNGQARYPTHEWLHGYRRYISDHNSDIDLYSFHCFGNFSQDQSYNVGEYNIFRLPRLSDFDGILLDLALIPEHELKEEVIIRARRASVPVISFLDKVPDLYFSGIDNYHAICTLMEHLITEHGCTKLNYVGGIIGNYENQQRFLAYRDTLKKHGIDFEPDRIYELNYEVETGLKAFTVFQERGLLPEAFVCANDNIAAGVCLAAQEAGELDLSTGKLLPEVSESDIPNVYFFAPVHFREREIGYLVLENCDYLLTHQFLFETLNTFRTSIEALYGKLILRKKNRQLSQLYIHDSLTGLYNRMAYEKLALPVFNQYMKSKKPVGIMFIDADHLKYINDTFGHDMGNLAISSIASVIRQHCPANSVSMRYGGDEFVCVIPDYDQTQMQKLKQNLLDSLATLSRNSRMAFPIEASIGFVVANDSVFSLNDYINLADEKMYVEKKERKATRQ